MYEGQVAGREGLGDSASGAVVRRGKALILATWMADSDKKLNEASMRVERRPVSVPEQPLHSKRSTVCETALGRGGDDAAN